MSAFADRGYDAEAVLAIVPQLVANDRARALRRAIDDTERIASFFGRRREELKRVLRRHPGDL